MSFISILGVFISILLTVVFAITGCTRIELAILPYVPPKYLNAVEVTAYNLVFLYNYSFAYPKRSLNGKVIIVKNIEITEEVINNSTKRCLNWGYSIYFYPANLSDLNRLRIGDKIDIVGICQGRPTGTPAVVLDNCIFEPSGGLSLPLSDGGQLSLCTRA